MRTIGKLMVEDMLPDYPVEWELLPASLFNELKQEYREADDKTRSQLRERTRILTRQGGAS